MQEEVNARVTFAKEHLNTTRQNITDLFNALKAEITDTFNELLTDAHGTLGEVKDVLVKAKDDALVKLDDSKKTTLDAWQKFKG